nr:hypothetical protein GCM10020092_076940 [Actinoplanes digitatis]
MRGLIDGLLSYATVREATVAPARVSLAETIADIALARTDAAVASGTPVPRFVIGELPSVQADPVLVRQLIDNLVGNAVKYTAPGVVPTLRISATQDEATVTVNIVDNGIGIPEGQHEAIFGNFYRAHVDSGYLGTGLGLAICRRIVERHGGTITATDDPGGGTRVTFTLPNGVVADRPVSRGVRRGVTASVSVLDLRCSVNVMTSTISAPTSRPSSALATVLTSQPATPPRAPVASWTASSRWCTVSYMKCRPSSSVPSQQDVTAHPQHRGGADHREHGEHPRHRLHQAAAEGGGGAGALCQAQPGVVHLHDEAHHAVDQDGHGDGDERQDRQARPERLVDHLVQRDDHDLGREDQVRAHRTGDQDLLVLGGLVVRTVCVLVCDPGPHLLGALVAQVGAAEHEDRGEQPGRELAEQQDGRAG